MKIKAGLYHVKKKDNDKYYIVEVIWINNRKTVRVIYPRIGPDYNKTGIRVDNFKIRFEFIERINVYDKV